jgi:hypothetical protein
MAMRATFAQHSSTTRHGMDDREQALEARGEFCGPETRLLEASDDKWWDTRA